MFIRTVVAAGFAALALAAPAAAQSDARSTIVPAYGDQRICTAQVPSFDGAPLDVDLTLPEGGGGSHPLIVFLHGFGNDKREWESLDDRVTAPTSCAGTRTGCAPRLLRADLHGARLPHRPVAVRGLPAADAGRHSASAGLPSGTIQIKSREVEIRDTQYLASKVADAFADVDRDRVAVSGGSYGGGESWLQAADPVWDHFTSPPLRLRVAVPNTRGPTWASHSPPTAGARAATRSRPATVSRSAPRRRATSPACSRGRRSRATSSRGRARPRPPRGRSTCRCGLPIVPSGDPYSPEDPIVRKRVEA